MAPDQRHYQRWNTRLRRHLRPPGRVLLSDYKSPPPTRGLRLPPTFHFPRHKGLAQDDDRPLPQAHREAAFSHIVQQGCPEQIATGLIRDPLAGLHYGMHHLDAVGLFTAMHLVEECHLGRGQK